MLDIQEAKQLGFKVTGWNWNISSKCASNVVKERINLIKKNYKNVECRIVTDRRFPSMPGYRTLVGNDAFLKADNFECRRKSIEQRLKTFEDDKVYLRKEYEMRLATLESQHEEDLQTVEEMKDFLKTK